MNKNQPIFVAYVRVSSKGQGLGLAAQMNVINQRISECGGVLIHEPYEYQDKESGAYDERERKGLERAIKRCKVTGATLIVQALDRLSRDLSDASRICFKEGISVIACDMSEDAMQDPVIFGVYAGIAQREREKIAGRIQRAVNVLKEKHLPTMKELHEAGKDAEAEAYWLANKSPRSRVTYQDWIRKNFSLGSPRNFSEEDKAKASESRRASADNLRNNEAVEAIKEYLKNPDNDRSLRAIAKHLEKEVKIMSPRGTKENPKFYGFKSVELLCKKHGIER